MNINDFKTTVDQYFVDNNITDQMTKVDVTFLTLIKVFESPLLKPFNQYLQLIESVQGGGSLMLSCPKFDEYNKPYNANYGFIKHENDMLSFSQFREYSKPIPLASDKEYLLNIMNLVENSHDIKTLIKNVNQYFSNESKDLSNEHKGLFKFNNVLADVALKGIVALQISNLKGKDTPQYSELRKYYPFSVLNEQGVLYSFGEIIKKPKEERIEAIKNDKTILSVLSNFDGFELTSNNALDLFVRDENNLNNTILGTVLSHDTMFDTINAIVDKFFYDDYKKNFSSLIFMQTLRPTYEDIVEEYPMIDDILNVLYQKFPYLNGSVSDLIEVRSMIEDTTLSDKELMLLKHEHIQQFESDLTAFGLGDFLQQKFKTVSSMIGHRTSTLTNYAATPITVLYNIVGRFSKNDDNDIRVLELEEVKFHSSIDSDTKKTAIRHFFDDCIKNNLALAYSEYDVDVLFLNVLEEYSDKLLTVNKSSNWILKDYVLTHIDLNYQSILKIQPFLNHMPEDYDKNMSDETLLLVLKKKAENNKIKFTLNI